MRAIPGSLRNPWRGRRPLPRMVATGSMGSRQPAAAARCASGAPRWRAGWRPERALPLSCSSCSGCRTPTAAHRWRPAKRMAQRPPMGAAGRARTSRSTRQQAPRVGTSALACLTMGSTARASPRHMQAGVLAPLVQLSSLLCSCISYCKLGLCRCGREWAPEELETSAGKQAPQPAPYRQQLGRPGRAFTCA